MKQYASIFMSLLLFAAAACNSEESRISKFKAINNSLDSANKVTDSINAKAAAAIHDGPAGSTVGLTNAEQVYESLLRQNSANSEFLMLADPLIKAVTHADRFVDSLQRVLQSNAGTEPADITNRLFTHQRSNQLMQEIMHVYNEAGKCIHNSEVAGRLDGVFQLYKTWNKQKNWADEVFKDVPAVAAMTLLNKFRKDYKQGAVIALQELELPYKR